MEDQNQPGRKVERGAQEDQSGTPLTETEARANTRPPSQPGKSGDGAAAKRDPNAKQGG